MHFCKYDCANLIKINFTFYIFFINCSILTFFQKTWSKQVLWNFSSKPKSSHSQWKCMCEVELNMNPHCDETHDWRFYTKTCTNLNFFCFLWYCQISFGYHKNLFLNNIKSEGISKNGTLAIMGIWIFKCPHEQWKKKGAL